MRETVLKPALGFGVRSRCPVLTQRLYHLLCLALSLSLAPLAMFGQGFAGFLERQRVTAMSFAGRGCHQ
jgi:hypothetical protein